AARHTRLAGQPYGRHAGHPPGNQARPRLAALAPLPVRVAACAAVAGQRWTRTAGGELTVHGGAKCLDALGRGSVDGSPVGIYDCTGGDNQKRVLHSDGTVRGLRSGLCLDANATTSAVLPATP
ncbi:RICIN domain-containing protein, partial [Kitasatospora purpeofusca]|uniref:RICIN domain-containing protein n=1 Tax=Kitasatospora purpeofusca TaxID=67352 RepID=UPI0030F2EB26